MRINQIFKPRPRHHLVHLVQKFLPLRALLFARIFQRGKTLLSHHSLPIHHKSSAIKRIAQRPKNKSEQNQNLFRGSLVSAQLAPAPMTSPSPVAIFTYSTVLRRSAFRAGRISPTCPAMLFLTPHRPVRITMTISFKMGVLFLFIIRDQGHMPVSTERIIFIYVRIRPVAMMSVQSIQLLARNVVSLIRQILRCRLQAASHRQAPYPAFHSLVLAPARRRRRSNRIVSIKMAAAAIGLWNGRSCLRPAKSGSRPVVQQMFSIRQLVAM